MAENGFLRYDGNEFTIFNTASGLRSDKISGLVADGKDNLFIAHDQGIDLFSIPGGTFSYLDDYTASDFRGFRLNSMKSGEDAGVLISSNKGFFRAESKAAFIPPKTMISSIELMNEKINREEMKRWKYSLNNLRFRFSSISYSNPGRINYRFRLENLEPEFAIPR